MTNEADRQREVAGLLRSIGEAAIASGGRAEDRRRVLLDRRDRLAAAANDPGALGVLAMAELERIDAEIQSLAHDDANADRRLARAACMAAGAGLAGAEALLAEFCLDENGFEVRHDS